MPVFEMIKRLTKEDILIWEKITSNLCKASTEGYDFSACLVDDSFVFIIRTKEDSEGKGEEVGRAQIRRDKRVKNWLPLGRVTASYGLSSPVDSYIMSQLNILKTNALEAKK